MNGTEAYRLEALLELGHAWPHTLTAAEIARRRGIPPKFLARLLGGLAREGLVVTARGARGGFRLAAAPNEPARRRLVEPPGIAPGSDPSIFARLSP